MVTALGDAVCEIVAGLYVGGSLATGDYRAGVSDIDAVAMLATAPRPGVRAALTAIHEGLANQFEEADALHWLPPVGSEELRQGARAAGSRRRHARRRVLITKTEAIARMGAHGVPADLVEGVARRRDGEQVLLTDEERSRRGEVVRQYLRDEFDRILADS